ncbi:murein hydrolase activator EnvC family protein [Amniculibacterium aquaticum]|uniref:murein hydrolase activator EnvC family protein n=1 Tax=Amniculibacterium aquaticum TaxID=2479858 RepID=UPI000F5B3374|nr:peptidoglycan DD-metalloendopeptidase family protein [Amniculibacterium aquaticum]
MSKNTHIILALITFGFSFGQQKKEQLQKQNSELKKEIASINKAISQSQKESKLSIAYLDNVNKKIVLREKVYNNTQKEKRFIEDDIYLRQLEINRQNRELAVLRKNYAKVLVNAYKNKGIQNKVTFILSSKSFGEAIRRVQYLKLYSEFQEKKAAEITDAARLLKESIQQKEKSVKEKETLLNNQKIELATINADRQQKEDLVKEFKANEGKLTAELRQKQAKSKALEGQIRSIIAEEIRIAKAEAAAKKAAEAEKIRLAKIAADKEKARIDAENRARAEALERERKEAEEAVRKANELAAKKAAEEKKRADDASKADADARALARKEAAAKEAIDAANRAKEAANKLAEAKAAEAALEKKNNEAKKAAENKALTNFGVTTDAGAGFANNKGKLSMPVYGTITHRFGRQSHPIFKNIVEENNGIKIAVTKGTVAKCVFPGQVTKILQANDGTKTVMVKHGDYFTVYTNLANTMVNTNQNVSAGTAIGAVGLDFDGTYTLDFQIYNSNGTAVDPMGWVN